MEAIEFLRKKYSIKGSRTIQEEIGDPAFNWTLICKLLDEFLQANRHEVLVIASEQRSDSVNGAVAEITEQLKQEFITMIGGYRTVYIGYAHEVANHQFLYKQEVDNYFNNILPGYLEKLLKQATASL